MKKTLIIVFSLIIIVIGLGFKLHVIPHVKYCNGIFALDYGAATDGPLNYVKLSNLETVAKCGGYCMLRDCSNTCPPKEWTCE